MKVKWPEPYPGAYWLDTQEEKAVLGVLRKRSLFRYYGLHRPRCVEAFEAAARKFYGVKHALAVNSGTGALMTAMTALGIGPGCEVIVPSFFWVATAGAIVQANAIPVLCEVDDSLGMDPTDLERKITPRTKLILPVHMAGEVCDMKAIMAVADRHGIAVLEDCAQCNGGKFRGQRVGTFGQVGVFSLQLNKNFTAGEGGLLVTNDESLYYRLNAAHDVGVPWVDGACKPDLGHVTWGAGRRMSELIGAVASVQLRKAPQIIRSMRHSKRRIKRMLAAFHAPGLNFRRLTDEQGDTACFLILILPDESSALELAQRLSSVRATRLAEYGMHIYYNIPQLVNKVPLSPAGNPWNLPQNLSSACAYGKGACPRSDDLFTRSVIIPVPSCLTSADESAAAQTIAAALPLQQSCRVGNSTSTR